VTLGQHLQNKRHETGRSLEQLAALTKIQLKILRAIEEDRYADLPAKAFTRGFIVNYAKALKLDPEAVMTEFHDFLEQKFNERPDRDQGHQGYAFEGKELEQNRRWMAVGMSLAGVFALAVLLIFKPSNHKRKEKHKEYSAETSESGESVEPQMSPDGKLLPVTSPSATPAALPADLAPILSPNPPTTTAEATPTLTPAETTTKPSAAPSATPAPVVTPTQAATPTPAASASPSPSPSPADKLHKGDALDPKEVKVRLTLQAQEDAVLRYRSDQLPNGSIILRKGRILVIKAKERILLESNPSAKLQIRIKNSPYQDLTDTKIEVKEGLLAPYSGAELGSKPIPDTIPQPKAE